MTDYSEDYLAGYRAGLGDGAHIIESRTWPIKLRLRLLINRDSRWNAWVRDFTAWLERLR